MRSIVRSKSLWLVLCMLVLGAAGVGYAAIPGSNGTISACRDSKGTLKVIDAEAGQTCSANQQLLTWNEQGPAGPQGPQGPVGPQGPSSIAQVVGASGGGPNPSATLQWFGAPVTVTVSSATQRVLVNSSNAFGTGSQAAAGLNLYICYRELPSGALTPVGNGLIGLRLPPNTRVPMGTSRVLQLAGGSDYLVGMCGTGGANWTNNDWGWTTALVVNQG